MSTAANRFQAGALSCILEGADIRDLRVGHQRVLTRLYIAVRDEKWNTIPFDCRQVAQRTSAGQFEVRLECRVDAPPVRAQWDVAVVGDAAGEFAYSISGQALGSFSYAKLGLNLHHPLPESLGARYLARRGEKAVTGTIPTLVEPQFFIDGKLTGMFMPYDELVLQASADDELVFRFNGDEFEMQDHRNWTDYNLKTYGTPLEVPLPLQAEDGQAIYQGVTIDLRRARGLRDDIGVPGAGHLERLAVDRSIVGQLPRLGSEFPDEAPEAGGEAHSLVAALGLDYVRLNLDLISEDAGGVVARRCRQVSSWERPVELVLVVSVGGARHEELARLDYWLEQAQPDLERVVVLEGPRSRGTKAGQR